MKTAQVKLSVPGIFSVEMAMLIESTVRKIRSVKPYVSLVDKTAQFWYNPKRVSKEMIIQKVKELGFDTVAIDAGAIKSTGALYPCAENPLFSQVVNGNMFEVEDVICRRDVTAKKFVYLCAAAFRGSGCAAEGVTKALCEKYNIDYTKPHTQQFSPGQGTISIVDDQTLVCGSKSFMKKYQIETSKQAEKEENHRIYAANSDGLAGWISLKYTAS